MTRKCRASHACLTERLTRRVRWHFSAGASANATEMYDSDTSTGSDESRDSNRQRVSDSTSHARQRQLESERQAQHAAEAERTPIRNGNGVVVRRLRDDEEVRGPHASLGDCKQSAHLFCTVSGLSVNVNVQLVCGSVDGDTSREHTWQYGSLSLAARSSILGNALVAVCTVVDARFYFICLFLKPWTPMCRLERHKSGGNNAKANGCHWHQSMRSIQSIRRPASVQIRRSRRQSSSWRQS